SLRQRRGLEQLHRYGAGGGTGRRLGGRTAARQRLLRRRPDLDHHAGGAVSFSAIASTSAAASECGKRVSSGVWVRMLSITLRSRRTMPASGGEKRRKLLQALSSVL